MKQIGCFIGIEVKFRYGIMFYFCQFIRNVRQHYKTWQNSSKQKIIKCTQTTLHNLKNCPKYIFKNTYIRPFLKNLVQYILIWCAQSNFRNFYHFMKLFFPKSYFFSLLTECLNFNFRNVYHKL